MKFISFNLTDNRGKIAIKKDDIICVEDNEHYCKVSIYNCSEEYFIKVTDKYSDILEELNKEYIF